MARTHFDPPGVTGALAVRGALIPMRQRATNPEPFDPVELTREIERYLSEVALFRALGHEPNWRDDGDIARSMRPLQNTTGGWQ